VTIRATLPPLLLGLGMHPQIGRSMTAGAVKGGSPHARAAPLGVAFHATASDEGIDLRPLAKSNFTRLYLI